jgi:hypothetical protein
MGKGFDRDILVIRGNGGTTLAVHRILGGEHRDVEPGVGGRRLPVRPRLAILHLITYDMGGTWPMSA